RDFDELGAGIEEMRSLTRAAGANAADVQDEDGAGSGASRGPIGVNIILHEGHNPQWRGQFETALKHKADVIIFSLGVKRDVVREAQAAGAKVFFDVTTLRHARVAAKSGVDAIIAVCQGAGGHAGTVTPFSLIPEIKADPIIDVPVLAAGAISNGGQMAAALCLGADGVYVGTRLIATPEARAAAEYKQMILASQASDIVYSPEISGIPANWLGPSYGRWKKSRDASGRGSEAMSLAGEGSGPSAKTDSAALDETGELTEELKRWRDIWSAGQGVAQIQAIEPAGDLVRNMARDCQAVLRKLTSG
ncbi:MAG: nitronate monooxygenase, partial [Leptospirales bacterium]